MIRVVCFDLGGVLVRITLEMAEAAQRAGVVTRASGSFMEFPPFIEFQAGRLSEAEYMSGLGAKLGVDPDDALRVHNHILVEPYPGTLELIQSLESQGVLCGCLSNTNAPHWAEMRLGDRFPNVARLRIAVASHEHRLEKPNPAIYELFRELAGAVRPDEIAFFDDTIVNVEAARALGWNSRHIDPSSDPADQVQHYLAITRCS